MKNLTVLLFILIITGCSTSYQSDSFTGGYTETQLADNIYKVSFRGNGYTSRSKAEDFTLLRCAELTLQQGYRFFIVIDGRNSSSSSTITTPTTTYSSATITGNSIYGSSNTYGGKTYMVSKPSSTNTIALLKEKPRNQFAYNAQMIFNNLKNKYDID